VKMEDRSRAECLGARRKLKDSYSFEVAEARSIIGGSLFWKGGHTKYTNKLKGGGSSRSRECWWVRVSTEAAERGGLVGNGVGGEGRVKQDRVRSKAWGEGAVAGVGTDRGGTPKVVKSVNRKKGA